MVEEVGKEVVVVVEEDGKEVVKGSLPETLPLMCKV